MKTLDRFVFKALANQISAEKLESYLYQEYVIDKIDSDKLLSDLVNINYREETWRKDLRNIVEEHFDETNLIANDLYFNCLNLIQVKEEMEIYDIINHLSNLYIKYEYEYYSLLEFYKFNERWNMVVNQVTNEKLSDIIQDIKNFARRFYDMYNITKDIEKLLNLSTNYSYESFHEVKKENVIDYIANKRINLESTNKFDNALERLYNKEEIKNIKASVNSSMKSKIIQRIPIFGITGLPLFTAGYLGIQRGNEGIIYVVFLLGFGLLMTVVLDVIQLIWHSRHK